MDSLIKWIKCIGSFCHWLTGWLVHPTKGGCCDTSTVKENCEETLKK